MSTRKQPIAHRVGTYITRRSIIFKTIPQTSNNISSKGGGVCIDIAYYDYFVKGYTRE